MLDLKIIGCGAAGNKATERLAEMGFDKSKLFYVNSTDRDLSQNVDMDHVIIFGGKSKMTLGGCGKERSIGKQMLLEDMRADTDDFDKIVGNENLIVLVGSTEGGSGSASLPILAKYYHEAHNKPVVCVLFFGFKDDVRGLQNSIEICQELSEEYGVIGIDNSGFLTACGGNRFKAEQEANNKFATVISILMGFVIQDGRQVIDDTDLFKIVTTPGYMIADGVELPDRIKTSDDYSRVVTNFIKGNTSFIDPPKNAGCSRIGAIYTLKAGIEEDESIDFSADPISNVYGHPYEYFIATGPSSDNTNKFYFIASGMKFPIDTIQAVYDEYKARSEKVDKTKDSFFSAVTDMRGDMQDAQFNMLGKPQHKAPSKEAKKNFFGSMGFEQFSSDGETIETGAVPKEVKEDY